MTTRTPALRVDTDAFDRDIADAEASAVVMWRGEPLPFEAVPAVLATTSGRGERDLLFNAYREALDALAPLRRRRLDAWTAHPDSAAATEASALATDLEQFALHSETPYYAALRRYLALIDIEQGDATIADLWHAAQGTAWAHWFGDREIRRAVDVVGRPVEATDALGGWRDAEASLVGATRHTSVPEAAASAAYGTLAGSPVWAGQEIGIAAGERAALADFAAFVRVWRVRHDVAMLQYELRLLAGPADPALSRAYYAGIVGHMIGVNVPEEGYLNEVPAPYASVRRLQVAMLAAQLVEVLERAYGTAWWRDAGSAELVARVQSSESTADALAHLGYDGLDWRPVLRQIRTRLIGEMSGYGEPNITTRAGTRKV